MDAENPARMIANPVAMQMERTRIQELVLILRKKLKISEANRAERQGQ